jgi:hypothetical protein
MLEIRLPFAGLYNSIHSYAIDEAVNEHTSWLLNEIDLEKAPEDIVDIVSNYIDYDKVKERICKKFVDYFNKFIGSDLVGIEIKFKAVWSPREYNVYTDQITCQISESDFKKLFELTHSIQSFKIVLKEELTSRSGFISNYSNDKQWWIDNFDTLTADDKMCLGFLCLKAVALDVDGHSSTWEQGIWEDMASNDEYGSAVAEACNDCKAAFKIGMYMQEQSSKLPN